MKSRISYGINRIIENIRLNQAPNGSWNYPFDTGITTDCYMIILLRALELHEEKLIKQLTDRIVNKQKPNGAWKLFDDEEEGNLSLTVEAYYALLYSGYYGKNNQLLKRARQFIIKKGGIANCHMLTKIMLTITGQLKWPTLFPLPVEMILLPSSFPVNFYDFSVYGRANLTPIMIMADNKFRLTTVGTPVLSELFLQKKHESILRFKELQEWRSFLKLIEQGIKNLVGLPGQIHQLAIEQAKQYMLTRIEEDGTLFNYFGSTFLMIFSLLSLGYSKRHPIITKAVKGLLAMKCSINGEQHIQFTTATVWNTSLLSTALQVAGVPDSDPMVVTANRYLLSRQHMKYGDWVVHNPSGYPGGWGFSNSNTIQPDIDDTTASLRAIARNAQTDMSIRQSWDRGLQWVLSMQNKDGGWPAFEKNTDNRILQLLPIEDAEYLISDPSTADLTGRTLEYLGSYTNLSKHHPAVKGGISWLITHQETNGSWYGRWGICYIYGTWAALTGLSAVGVPPSHHSIRKAVEWLQMIQNHDGGWGESCNSDIKRTYIPLKASTLTHTAWAIDALISTSEKPTPAIKKGISFLLNNLEREDWSTSYPKGQGMAGFLYMHYHSYRFIFPLLALSHYRTKYLKYNEM
ncbi:prenyltransferase/squalene oxidase repeat-containing protein [Niallia oryzisoli]|uniref:terpene cyclase/mutase family protein n=1 Tax=Niallia oryzisoli TaxID=1737571 RepID=UPI00373612FB